MNHKFNRKVATLRRKHKQNSTEWLSILTDEMWMQDIFEGGYESLENLDTEGNWCRWYKDGHKEIIESKFDLWTMYYRPTVYERKQKK